MWAPDHLGPDPLLGWCSFPLLLPSQPTGRLSGRPGWGASWQQGRQAQGGRDLVTLVPRDRQEFLGSCGSWPGVVVDGGPTQSPPPCALLRVLGLAVGSTFLGHPGSGVAWEVLNSTVWVWHLEVGALFLCLLDGQQPVVPCPCAIAAVPATPLRPLPPKTPAPSSDPCPPQDPSSPQTSSAPFCHSRHGPAPSSGPCESMGP